MLLFLFACVHFMLFMLVKFSRKKNRSLKLVLITSTNILLKIHRASLKVIKLDQIRRHGAIVLCN